MAEAMAKSHSACCTALAAMCEAVSAAEHAVSTAAVALEVAGLELDVAVVGSAIPGMAGLGLDDACNLVCALDSDSTMA